MRRRRFLALPQRDEAANLAILALFFALWFGLCYCGAAALVQFIPWRMSVQLPIDSQIPFWPGAAAIYLTIVPMLLVAPFVLRDQASLLRLCCALLIETTAGALCFLLLPVDDIAVQCCTQGLAGVLFQIADALNLHNNNLPSLHVAFATTLALAFAIHSSRPGKLIMFLWVLALDVSTLVTRQHFVLDVFAGTLLALVSWPVAGGWASRPAVAAAVDVELLCLRNAARFVRRNRRYLLIVLAIWPRRRLARTGFCFLQALDDVLDGDRSCECEPLQVADEMLQSFASGQFGGSDLARLGAAFRCELLARGGAGQLAIVRRLIGAMRNDRVRVLEHALWTREQLMEQGRATFAPSLDLMMLAADSPLRHGDVPLLVDALGWCSTVRDLHADLARGLVSIPKDVFMAAQLEQPGAALPALATTTAVRQWLAVGNHAASALLDRVDAEIAGLHGRRGARLLHRFARSMRKYLH